MTRRHPFRGAPSGRSRRKEAEHGRAAAGHARLRGSARTQHVDERRNFAVAPAHHHFKIVYTFFISTGLPATRASTRTRAVEAIEPAEGLGGAHSYGRNRENDPGARAVEQRKHPIAATESEDRSPLEELWDIGTQPQCHVAQSRVIDVPQTAQRADRGGGVAAAAAETGLHWNAFGEMNPQAGGRAASTGRVPDLFRRPPDEIRGIRGTRRIVAGQREIAACPRQRQPIVQRDRLKDCTQLMVAVRADAKDAQRQINFGERSDAQTALPRAARRS